MLMLKLSFKSIWNRRFTTILTIFSVALSTFLLLGVERIRNGARHGFESTISGTDLVVGARSAPVQLLFYSVFGIGNPTNNVSWTSYEKFAHHPEVLAAVPISLGDSHKGFRVIGTTPEYFNFYRYGQNRNLQFENGRSFAAPFEAVIGAEVADKLGYKPGAKITLSHGTGEIVFQEHTGKFFTIIGVLKPTGTPVDRALFVSLDSMAALHEHFYGNGSQESNPAEIAHDHQDSEISAFYLKLRSKMGIFNLEREINEYQAEPLSAILPGMALQELWKVMDIVEKAFVAMSVITYAVSLTGMMMVFLTTLNERRREMAILRSVGARPWFLSGMLLFEAGLLSAAGIAFAFLALNAVLLSAGRFLENRLGLSMALFVPESRDVLFLCFAFLVALTTALVPAWRAYRNSLSDGLTVRA